MVPVFRHFVSAHYLTRIEHMEFVDYSVVASAEDDDQFLDGYRSVTVARLGRRSRRVLDALPLQVERLLVKTSRLVRGRRLHFV